MTSFPDAINAARDALDAYSRERTDAHLLAFIAACDALKTCHDDGVLARAAHRLCVPTL